MAKTFRMQDLAPEHLAGGSLAKILPAVVVPEKAWAKHVEIGEWAKEML